MLTGTLCDETQPYFVAFRSEFVVSRARLRAQPLNTYQKLHSYVAVRLPVSCCAEHDIQFPPFPSSSP